MRFSGEDTAIYARLSQDRSGLSVNVQIQTEEGEAFAEENNLTVVARFRDNDISASKHARKKSRPDYDRLVVAVRRGEIEIILCTEMTRLYRTVEELLTLIRLAETTRLIGIWTTDNIGYDLSTPEGIHAAIGAVNNAVLESAKISKRQKRKKNAQAKTGRRSGGGRPFGYDYAADGNLTINKHEAAIYRSIVKRFIAGERESAVVRSLNEKGILTPTGKRWRESNLKRLVLKKTYIGVRTHNDAEYPAVWPALITAEQYELMEAAFAAHGTKRGPNPVKGRRYLLTGFIYCQCGAHMFGNGRTLRSGSYQRRYICRRWNNHGDPVGCGKVFRDADALEEWVSEAVLYRFDSPEVAVALAPKKDEGRVKKLVTDYDLLQRRLKELNRDYYTSTEVHLTREEYATTKADLEAKIEANRDELADIQSQQALAVVPSTQAVRELWPTAGMDWKRNVILLIVGRVTVQPGHPGSKKWNGHRFDPDAIQIMWKH
jgi:site-specific DNA recombinase